VQVPSRAVISSRARHAAVSTGWQTIGRVGAVGVIRTFLKYFLERDVAEQQRECAAEPAQPP